jgi:phytoene dehydrogenase-like protein
VSDAIVVGSGPNGLAAAVALAREGVRVTVLEASETLGGGTRSGELTVPGVIHDYCSAAHPMAVDSPFLSELGLERHGLEWRWPEIDFAHPLDDGSAPFMKRSIEETVAGLGADGRRWERLFGSPARHLGELNDDLMRPVQHLPRHPLRLLRFGIPAAMPATLLARTFADERTRALWGGAAAHAFAPLGLPMSSAVGVALVTAGHHSGWPVARGGSGAISSALVSLLAELGGRVETGVRVRSLAELPPADAVILDLSPRGAAEVCGDRLPPRVARAYRRYRRGPGAYKVDMAVEGPVPWRNPDCGRAGTVHAIGSFAEVVAAERDVNRGRMPERPFVLVCQQAVADPSRSAGDVHPLYSYAHVPSGFDGDATDAVIDQIERFAPGLRERIVATAVSSPADLEAGNANYAGGDIITGANDPLQILFRPRLAADPYATGIPGVFICSAATPPGAGAHGMCGYNAARSALRAIAAA